MSALGFLLVALVLSGIGSTILVLRARKPTSAVWSIEEFRREMNALSPEGDRSDSPRARFKGIDRGRE